MPITPHVSPIALLRFVQGLSQAELAAKARLSRETISRLERGELPRLDTARAVSDALGVDIAFLFPEDERPAAATPGARTTQAAGDGHVVEV